MSLDLGSRVAQLARPALRPGFRVVRRDDTHLQLGLDDPDRLVLRDQPGLREALTRPERTAPGTLAPVLDRLVAEGWIVDADRLRADARAKLASRSPVALHAHPTLADTVRRACTVAGVESTEPRHSSSGATRLVADVGEPRRALADQLMRDDVPHLWVAALPGAVRIGPFVQPGRTACLRCVDAHLADRDPRRPRVLHQLEREPPVAHSVDAGLVALAAAWAARDLARALDGEPPSLSSTTVTVTDALDVTRCDWLRHPHCGCAWG